MIGQFQSARIRAAVDANLVKQGQVAEKISRLERERTAAAGDDKAFDELHERLTGRKAQLRALQDAGEALKGELAPAESREADDQLKAHAEAVRRKAASMEREVIKRFGGIKGIAEWLPELAAHIDLVDQ